MSHVEPEHNRPQEGEEPDEPFPPITTTGSIANPSTIVTYCDDPTTGEVCGFSGDTIPTTGELEPFAMEIGDDNVLCVLYDDAKAALAAERRRAESWKQLHAEISKAWLDEKNKVEELQKKNL
jgi:hypothetical protein